MALELRTICAIVQSMNRAPSAGNAILVNAFITLRTAREGGAERANYQMFLTKLCTLIGVDKHDPSGSSTELNDF
jgi:hypothetical protein